MPEKKLYRTAALISAGCALLAAAVFWGTGHGSTALAIGFLAGLVCSQLGLWLFFRAWGAQPDKGRVLLLYGAHVAVVFGSILVCMFVPGVDALGAVVPQLFPIPVLALLFALQKGD